MKEWRRAVRTHTNIYIHIHILFPFVYKTLSLSLSLSLRILSLSSLLFRPNLAGSCSSSATVNANWKEKKGKEQSRKEEQHHQHLLFSSGPLKGPKKKKDKANAETTAASSEMHTYPSEEEKEVAKSKVVQQKRGGEKNKSVQKSGKTGLLLFMLSASFGCAVTTSLKFQSHKTTYHDEEIKAGKITMPRLTRRNSRAFFRADIRHFRILGWRPLTSML